MKYASKTIASKWKKTGLMLKDSRLKPYIPETRPFSRQNLRSMLNRYKMLYFKPTNGTGGNKIIRIERSSSGGYRMRGSGGYRSGLSANELYARLKAFANRKSYLLQKGIDLAHTGGKPFDLRVMVQKSNAGHWSTTAVFAKIGKKGKVVNNYHQGGRLARLIDALKGAGYSRHRIRDAHERLSRLGKNAGRCFDRHRNGFRELGLDVAIDKQGRHWILETNTRPQYYPVKHLDKTAYRRITAYAKQYGRIKSK